MEVLENIRLVEDSLNMFDLDTDAQKKIDSYFKKFE